MLYWLIPLALIVLAALILIFVVIKKIPRMREIDVTSIPKERERKLKHDLILNRLQRTKSDKFSAVGKVATGAAKGASKIGRRAVQRLYKLEQYYKKLQETQGQGDKALSTDKVKMLIAEAERLEKQGEFIPAEKRYIEVISHNPKEVDAYEGLGNMYFKNKQYKQARETFSFALKLEPKDASILMSMGELEMAEEKPKAALEYLRKAIEIRPGNPKYLDLYIEASLQAKEVYDATSGINSMKEVNAENSKIPEWQSKLRELTGRSTESEEQKTSV